MALVFFSRAVARFNQRPFWLGRRHRRRGRSGFGSAALFAALSLACITRSPVGTTYIGPERRLAQSALDGDSPSALSAWALRLADADDRFDDDPIPVLARVHAACCQLGTRGSAFVLAELAYLTGKRTDDRDAFLLAAVAAFTFLEGDEEVWGERPSPYDRRFRWACDIYNRGLGRAFAGTERGTLELVAGPRQLAVGSLEVAVDLSPFPFSATGISLLLADEFDVRGLAFRVRDSGLGVPLIAVVRRALETTAAESDEDLDRTSVSATAFLRLEGDLRELADGIAATLELHSTNDAKSVTLGERRLPLEADHTATVAYGTELAGYWRRGLTGLFLGRDAARSNGLVLPRPYEPGRIPVVLVHGTGSSPTHWAELLNTMATDPMIRAKYQFWLFIYTSGNPIAYSAASLRDDLTAFVDSRDPDGEDAALRRMILIGHSQGGLLVRMMGVTMDADDIFQRYLGEDLDVLGLDEKEEALIRRMFDIEPLPFAERLVYISTPHRGSFLAKRWFAPLLAKMIAVPGEVVNTSETILRGIPEDELPRGMKSRVPTSLDNMNPDSPFLAALLAAPTDARLHEHSIIAIGTAEEPAGADDGVVEYESAHLEGVDSEVLVASEHSCQTHPRTLLEVRRILRIHLGLEDRSPSGTVPLVGRDVRDRSQHVAGAR